MSLPKSGSSQRILIGSKQQHSSQGKESNQQKSVSFIRLFRFADRKDKLLMLFGSLAAALIGIATPSFALLWGNITTTFGEGDSSIVSSSRSVMFQLFGIGCGSFIAAWIMYACWMITGQRQAIKCRKEYLKSLLAQQIGWFDQVNQAQISSSFSADCFSFQGAIGQKVSLIVLSLAMFVAGFVIAFIKGWKMAFVTLAAIPALGITGTIFITAIQTKDKRNAQYYMKAGGLAQQAISSIKTIKQLNGEQFQIANFQQCLHQGSKKGLKYNLFAALAQGLMSFSLMSAHALSFWYGSNCVQGNSHCSNGKYKPGDVLVVFFCILMAAINLTQLSPSIKKIAQGKSAAARIFQIIDRESLVKNSKNPKIISHLVGNIEFVNVTFAYPKNKNVKVLKNLSLQFEAHNVALVGESGCGKSTIFQLIMRFYDPDEGAIYLDGINLKQLNLGWLRSQIGYVGQEPVLFAMTIKQNLSFGKENATEEQLNDALQQAEALEFVKNLDDGLNTFVGSGGGQLSGGQKQRIAIARALLRNPAILLLDQATSALDRKNQKLIQMTLDKISASRTTISIAHRTKTIMHADLIYVLNEGVIQQKGKFSDLNRFKDYTDFDDNAVEQSQAKHANHALVAVPLAKDQNLLQIPSRKTKQQIAKQEQIRLKQSYGKDLYFRLIKFSEGNKLLLVFGLCFSITAGLVPPTFTIFFSKMLKTLFGFSTNPVQARQDANYYALIFVFLAICGFFSNLMNSSIFSIVGDKVTTKVRLQTFSKIIKMPISWFDLPKNNVGKLTNKLASDSLMVNGLVATFISVVLQNLATLIAGLTIAFVFEWRTALFAIAMLPFMIIAAIINQKRKAGFSDKTDEIYKESTNLIVQCMANIRTVQSFGYEDIVIRKYDQKLQGPLKLGIKKGNVSGLLFALSQITSFFVLGLIFFLGSIFKRDNHLEIDSVFTAIYAIYFSAMTIGNNSHFLPDIQQGKLAAARLFQIIDGEDEDQIQLRQKSKMLKTPISGHIVINSLSFKYETRNTPVFEGFNLQIKKGSKVAFVGTSGCGKSTLLQLLQRFYVPTSGSILLDGIDIKDYDIHYLRSILGVVSQEPTLFNGSFKYNIQYNLPEVSMEEIIKAVTNSNSYSFIMGKQKIQQIPIQPKIPNEENKANSKKAIENSDQPQTGFDRNVGLKGSQISGGQKQRVAIARTLLRNPKVLLLDQATSALDSANQLIVQQALDRIMEGKTTVSVAHRIETIKNSDQIQVFEKGAIVQSGNYNQLVKKKGYFYNLERGTELL